MWEERGAGQMKPVQAGLQDFIPAAVVFALTLIEDGGPMGDTLEDGQTALPVARLRQWYGHRRSS